MAAHTLRLSKNQSTEHYHEINSHWMLTVSFHVLLYRQKRLLKLLMTQI